MKNNKLKFFITFILIFLTVRVLTKDIDINQFKNILKTVNLNYVSLGFIALFVYLFIEMVIIDDLLKSIHKVKGYWVSFKAMVVGQYYSLITPFSSGGQPVQLYIMGKDKIPLSKATAVLVNKFVFFQVGVTIYSMVLFLYNFSQFKDILQKAFLFVSIGLSINVVGLTFIIMLFYNPHKLKYIVYKGLKILYKIKVVKNVNKKYKKFSRYVNEYKSHIIMIRNNKYLMIKSVVLTFIQLTAYFSITYFVYRAFNLKGHTFVEILSLQSFLYMAVCFMPLPGTLGVGEIGFHAILGIVFKQNVLVYAMLLWRIISYYANLIISGIMTLIIHIIDKKNEKILRQKINK